VDAHIAAPAVGDADLSEPHRSPRVVSRAHRTVLAVLLLLGAALPVAAAEPEANSDSTGDESWVIPGEVVVQLRASAGMARLDQRGMRVTDALGGTERVGEPMVVSTGGRAVDQAIADLRADPAVAFAEPNYRVELADETGIVVNDPETADQYSLDRMRVRDAWTRETGAANVIAVLDTGVQSSHPDLAGRLVAGIDLVNDDANATDDNGHGTWVSGIIVANANDGYGIAGISWTDKVMPVKIMDGEGIGSTANLMEGIRWAADHGADVINMSVGGFPYSQVVQDAVNYAYTNGVVLVGAAGNNRREETYYPASYDNVVSVSATQPQDELSNWSSWGPKVDVSAPGSSVLTTNCYTCTYADHDSWGTHTYISGTSFATPNVAGVVALIRARYPTYTPSQVVSRLVSTVDDLGYGGWDGRYGAGRVNAFRAVGGSVAGPSLPARDSLEMNNARTSARRISLSATSRPSIYPAGDIDWFAVDVPRAGRLDVRVTGIVDNRAYPWNRSPIPIDPIVELYTTSGTLLRHVDGVTETGTELAQTTVAGATRILVKVWNWYANGNPATYTVLPSYVDTARPKAQVSYPAAGAAGVSRIVRARVTFDEAVTNVTSSTVRLRDVAANTIVPATVSYDSSSRTATITATSRLGRIRQYRVEATTGVTDIAGNALAATTALTFTTGPGTFPDADGNKHESSIEWIYANGITSGCAPELFCPNGLVTRGQMATFLARALGLPASTRDHFVDDESNKHESAINRIADAGITAGCDGNRFCPDGVVTRAQMATFLVRALNLPHVGTDYFTDDIASTHEANINAVASAGLTTGCGPSRYCPSGAVTRAQMATFLARAFRD
jgi:type VII secretion-associated serine protease mycosin